MTTYKHLRLDELGITSLEEAEEMELELDVRFREFTPDDRKTWLRQNAYLEHYARTRTVTTSARKAGVSVFAAKAWKRNDTLGYTRRLEISELEFSDRLEELALERASDPKGPCDAADRAAPRQQPEKFSRNGHKCDTSKSDEILHRLREDAQREKAAGYPGLRAMVQRNSEPSVVDLSPAGGETQRGGSFSATPYDAEEAPTHDRPSPTRHTGGGTSPRTPIRGRYPEKAPTSEPNHFQDISSSPDTPEDPYHDDYHAEAVRPDEYPPFDTEEDLAYFDLSSTGRKTQRGDASPTIDYDHVPSEKPPNRASPRLFQKARPRAERHKPDTFKAGLCTKYRQVTRTG